MSNELKAMSLKVFARCSLLFTRDFFVIRLRRDA